MLVPLVQHCVDVGNGATIQHWSQASCPVMGFTLYLQFCFAPSFSKFFYATDIKSKMDFSATSEARKQKQHSQLGLQNGIEINSKQHNCEVLKGAGNWKANSIISLPHSCNFIFPVPHSKAGADTCWRQAVRTAAHLQKQQRSSPCRRSRHRGHCPRDHTCPRPWQRASRPGSCSPSPWTHSTASGQSCKGQATTLSHSPGPSLTRPGNIPAPPKLPHLEHPNMRRKLSWLNKNYSLN